MIVKLSRQEILACYRFWTYSIHKTIQMFPNDPDILKDANFEKVGFVFESVVFYIYEYYYKI